MIEVGLRVFTFCAAAASAAALAAAAASAEGMSDEYKKLGEQVIREMPMKSLLGQMPGEQVEQQIGQLNCLLAQ